MHPGKTAFKSKLCIDNKFLPSAIPNNILRRAIGGSDTVIKMVEGEYYVYSNRNLLGITSYKMPRLPGFILMFVTNCLLNLTSRSFLPTIRVSCSTNSKRRYLH